MLNESLIYLYHSWLHEKDENIIGSKFSNFGLMNDTDYSKTFVAFVFLM